VALLRLQRAILRSSIWSEFSVSRSTYPLPLSVLFELLFVIPNFFLALSRVWRREQRSISLLYTLRIRRFGVDHERVWTEELVMHSTFDLM
jgi:hypothetical protein